MRRFWSFYQNESYQVGCSGRTVYIYDKAGNELVIKQEMSLRHSAISPMRIQPLLCRERISSP